ncbi:hypothetical protein BT93_J1791 [Corymbia citriodora subsp. variegata]|nr:hypothetical protein BT93_J1791 [Corymbia citriodora subsp. variegata]
MEDDDEIRSPPTPGPPSASTSPSPSPSPPRGGAANGRITVTVPPATGAGADADADATVSPAQPQPQPQPQLPQNSLALALPIQHLRSGVGGGGGGREDCWSEGATAVLIDAWGERYLELSRGNLKQKHWKEVADVVSGRDDYTKPPKSDIQCKNRIDTVKKKYKLEKTKIAAGAGPSKWRFFDKLDHLIGPSAKYTSPAAAAAATPSPVRTLKDVPVGIPVGIRSSVGSQHKDQRSSQSQQQHKQGQQQPPRGGQKMQIRKRRKAESESEPEFSDNDGSSTDSLPPEIRRPKRPKLGREVNLNEAGARPAKQKAGSGLGSSIGDLTRAIASFGEVYEQTESAKLQQVVEMEKQRMKFAKELELQRMQFFMKTQVRPHSGKKVGDGGRGGGRGGGGGSGGNHQRRSDGGDHNNNSDDSN